MRPFPLTMHIPELQVLRSVAITTIECGVPEQPGALKYRYTAYPGRTGGGAGVVVEEDVVEFVVLLSTIVPHLFNEEKPPPSTHESTGFTSIVGVPEQSLVLQLGKTESVLHCSTMVLPEGIALQTLGVGSPEYLAKAVPVQLEEVV